MKKKLLTLALAAGLIWGCVTEAKAIEFKASGEWLIGLGAVDNSLKKNNENVDIFQATQRVRLQLDAIASEYLSATVQIQMGDSKWGNAEEGGALGADGRIISLRSAYVDWYVPNTELQLRMGIFGAAMPNAAGGSAVFDEQVAGIVANYDINDMATVTAMWLRPFNDNYANSGNTEAWFDYAEDGNGYLDNFDLFGLSATLRFEGVEVTPWILYGTIGANTIKNADVLDAAGNFVPMGFSNAVADRFVSDGNAYSSQFYAGLPIIVSAFDPFNIEFDINYGYSSGFGNWNMFDVNGNRSRADSRRSGWVIKTLVEYNMDWGRPGLFAWYATGDDGDVKNGSERMPTLTGTGNFTSFIQDGYGWGAMGESGLKVEYDGTWAIGLQVADFSFMEDLTHTIRVTYWGGTNSTEMIKYMGADGWADGIYLTTDDYLVEINFDTVWSIYDNLNAIFEVGYIFNGINTSTWDDKGGAGTGVEDKSDAFKVNLIMEYSF